MHGRIVVARVFGAKQFVERGNAVRLGRRNLQDITDVVEPTSTDPANVGLQRVERRKQQMAPIALARHATAHQPLGFVNDNSRVGRQDIVDRSAFGVGRVVDSQVKISHAVLLVFVVVGSVVDAVRL